MMYHKQCNPDSASDKSKLFLCPVWRDPSFQQVKQQFMLTRFLWPTCYCDSPGGSIKGSVCVCLYVYVYVYWVCMCKWRGWGGWGVRQRNTARAIVDTVLESAFVIHYDIFEKMLCMVHNAFLKNIWIFCFVHCCFATICCIIILENNCHVWRICWMRELFIFLKSWYCQLSNVPMICLCTRLFRIAFIK